METRFTVYAVARFRPHDAPISSDAGIPFGHAATEDEARERARELDAKRTAHPTRIVERGSDYPFDVVRVVWRYGEPL